jgi:uncharacterized delta-60 repeat protein
MRFAKVIFVLALVSSSSFSQQAGDLDLSFGANGIVITDVTDSLVRDYCYAITMHPFGHIYAGGTIFRDSNVPPWAWMTIVKYNPDGSIDTSFGDNGRVYEYDFGRLSYFKDVKFYGNNQSVVMTGYYLYNTNIYDLVVFRYDQLGQRDVAFGNAGEVWLNNLLPGRNEQPTKLAVQYDAKILVGGLTADGNGNTDYLLLRLNMDGTLDNSFNNAGYITGNFSSAQNVVKNILIQADNKILLTVSSQNEHIIRFNPDGTFDNTFGNNGIVETDFGNINSIIINTDGKILASCADQNFQNILVRFNPDGMLDGSFNSGNPVLTDISLTKLQVQFDGKIVGIGSEYQMGYLIKRFNADGTYDTSFGNNGNVSVNLTPNQDLAYDLFIQNDRKILAAGIAWTANDNQDFGLARLLSSPIVPNTPVQIGDGLSNLSFYNFSNLGLPAVEQVTAVSFPNTPPPNLPGDSPLVSSVVNRYYDLSVSPQNAGTSSNFSATLRLYYSDDEVVALDESKLKLIRYNGLGWDYVGGSVNTVENYVEASDITKFNIFAFADPDSITLDVEDELYGLNEYQLEQNYPNPFNPTTLIQFAIPEKSDVTLKVFDVLGTEVATLVDEEKNPGRYEIVFAGQGISSGVYFYKLQAGNYSSIKKMILLK